MSDQIEATAGTQDSGPVIQQLQIEQITTDAGTQSRMTCQDSVVRDYALHMKEGVEFPPVVVYFDGEHYYLADGFHRVLAVKSEGHTTINTEVRHGTKCDALHYSLSLVGSGMKMGLRYFTGDRKNAVTLALKSFKEATQQEIAELCGVSQGYVSQVKDLNIKGNNHTRTNKRGQRRPSSYRKKKNKRDNPPVTPPANPPEPEQTQDPVPEEKPAEKTTELPPFQLMAIREEVKKLRALYDESTPNAQREFRESINAEYEAARREAA